MIHQVGDSLVYQKVIDTEGSPIQDLEGAQALFRGWGSNPVSGKRE